MYRFYLFLIKYLMIPSFLKYISPSPHKTESRLLGLRGYRLVITDFRYFYRHKIIREFLLTVDRRFWWPNPYLANVSSGMVSPVIILCHFWWVILP